MRPLRALVIDLVVAFVGGARQAPRPYRLARFLFPPLDPAREAFAISR